MEKNIHLNQAGSLIHDHHLEILDTLTNTLTNEQIINGLKHLLYIIEGRVLYGDEFLTYQGVKKAGYERSINHSSYYLELVEFLPYLSEGIENYVRNVENDYMLTMDERLRLSKEIERTILHYNAGYSNGYTEMLKNNRSDVINQSLIDLSVPIIKVENNIGVCPLIGEIDSNRASVLMSKTLNNVSEDQIDYLIFDLTGLGTVDELVAKYLFDVVYSMELIGTQIIFTGITKQLAMTAVSLGINLGEKNIHQTVQDAMRSINKSA